MKKRSVSRMLTTMLSSAMIIAQMGAPISVMAADEYFLDDAKMQYSEDEESSEALGFEDILEKEFENETKKEELEDRADAEFERENDYQEDIILLNGSSGTCGENLTYTIDGKGILTISGTGEMTNYHRGADSLLSPFFDDTEITRIIIEDGVTSIGDDAFFNCKNVSSIVIPNSVTKLGNYSLCGCEKLTDIVIPDNVSTIGEGAFGRCSNLKSIEIPDSVSILKDSLFMSCSGLESIELPANLTEIEGRVFYGCESLIRIEIPVGVESIGYCAFYKCKNMKSISIPEGIKEISERMFSGCTLLSVVYLPMSTTLIAENAFEGCSNLKDIYFLGKMEDWGKITIEENDVLKNVKIHYEGESILPVDLKWEKPGTFSFIVGNNGLSSYDAKIYYNGDFVKSRDISISDNTPGKFITQDVYDLFDKSGKYTVTIIGTKYGKTESVSADIEWESPSNKLQTPSVTYVYNGSLYANFRPVNGAAAYAFIMYVDGQIKSTNVFTGNLNNYRIIQPVGGFDVKQHRYEFTVKALSDDLANCSHSDEDNKYLFTMENIPQKGEILFQKNDGTICYYIDGVFQKEVSGFVEYDGYMFFLVNGIVDPSANGLVQDIKNTADWYYCAAGQAQNQYTGLVEYDGAWFYVNKGKLDTTMAAYVEYDVGLFYVGAGRIMTEVNGLAQDPMGSDWYYLANGQVQLQYTGLAQYDGEWFYVLILPTPQSPFKPCFITG